MDDLHARCAMLMEDLNLADRQDISKVTALTGGVASDIAKVDVNGRSFVVKFALAKLKVAEDWRAPVHRNAAEYAWLQVAADVSPNSAVRLFGRSEQDHGFAMEFLTGDDVFLWKDALLSQIPTQEEARLVGDLLGRIHSASAMLGFDAAAFQNIDDFRALRIEPYLSFTAGKHTNIAAHLNSLADMLYDSNHVLVHGDVSPKNIVFRASGPVLLDAECATMGDASFDPSFCLNHLVLKAIHLPDMRSSLLDEVAAFWAAYRPHVTWETQNTLESRICHLLPALMLARVDGKSPVEYLTVPEQDLVRQIAIELITKPSDTLDRFTWRLSQMLKENNA
ncbi:phosphotransferase family enzyme [Shimia isoporae]|uniref:Phosphotransferase family enzyme n=1 Tax=Shimia isoporae TaxID=647720 RepID=A0A4R1N9S1_9RHOB|nr:aminoglycoside phosphotransferase family protein [Shimia isoporae]TCL00552.1 phosphotransferase family enzyme [Shimia isoporae]